MVGEWRNTLCLHMCDSFFLHVAMVPGSLGVLSVVNAFGVSPAMDLSVQIALQMGDFVAFEDQNRSQFIYIVYFKFLF